MYESEGYMREIMRSDMLRQKNVDPFGLRALDFRTRVPERAEMFTRDEALTYIQGCDYPASVDDWLLAREVANRFGKRKLRSMHVLDVMSGPGRLGRELSKMGAKFVMEHDGDDTMLQHARQKAHARSILGRMGFVKSPVERIALPDNQFDLVISHNSTHQMSSLERLREAMTEMFRLTKPGGSLLVADYQRNTSPEFLTALEERLRFTKPSIVPLLLPTFTAAFSKKEFSDVLRHLPGVSVWSVTDAEPPRNLSPWSKRRINRDPVKGHVLDFSPISLRAFARKEET
jgi:ubiquinone/menaquinone biosynthesis C-methylase UbiE